MAAVTGEKPDKPPAQQARLQQALQPHLSEMFFASKVIFVEGIEDTAYITSWLVLSGRWDEFRRHGAHIVAVNGKSYLPEPVIVAQYLGIPAFVIFDADGNVVNANNRPKHEKDNRALLELLSGDPTQPFPAAAVWADKFVQWPTNLGDALKSEVGQQEWDASFGQATKGLGSPEGSFAKNPVRIGDHVALLHGAGKIPPSLDRLCKEVIRFAASH